MGKPELGDKRTCPSCAARFYDLRRELAVCPKCGTLQARPARAVPAYRRAGATRVGRGKAADPALVADDAAEVVAEEEAEEAESGEDEDGVPEPIDADDADPANEVDGMR